MKGSLEPLRSHSLMLGCESSPRILIHKIFSSSFFSSSLLTILISFSLTKSLSRQFIHHPTLVITLFCSSCSLGSPIRSTPSILRLFFFPLSFPIKSLLTTSLALRIQVSSLSLSFSLSHSLSLDPVSGIVFHHCQEGLV